MRWPAGRRRATITLEADTRAISLSRIFARGSRPRVDETGQNTVGSVSVPIEAHWAGGPR